jgi:hypothetical protein
VQSTHASALGAKLPQPAVLESISWWTRTRAAWGFLSPSAEQGRLVTDGLTRDERSIDVLTGAEPTQQFGGPFRLGAQWARYSRAIAREENKAYQAAFRTYLGKRGPAWEGEAADDRLGGVDVYWASGTSEPGATAKLERLFRQGRGGKRFDVPGMAPRRPTAPVNALDAAKSGTSTTLRPLRNLPAKTADGEAKSPPVEGSDRGEQAPDGAPPRDAAVGPQPDGAPPQEAAPQDAAPQEAP